MSFICHSLVPEQFYNFLIFLLNRLEKNVLEQCLHAGADQYLGHVDLFEVFSEDLYSFLYSLSNTVLGNNLFMFPGLASV